jgi:hypothetical protein
MSRTERAQAYYKPCAWSVATHGAVDMPTDEEHAAAATAEAARFREAECFLHMLGVVAEPVFDSFVAGLARCYGTTLAECGGDHAAALARLRGMRATKEMVAAVGCAVRRGLVNSGETAVRSAEDKSVRAQTWFNEWCEWHCCSEGDAGSAGVLLHDVIFK